MEVTLTSLGTENRCQFHERTNNKVNSTDGVGWVPLFFWPFYIDRLHSLIRSSPKISNVRGNHGTLFRRQGQVANGTLVRFRIWFESIKELR